MKLSVVTAVLDSHEIVRRQLLHYERAIVPGVEIIMVDDGSDPPIEFPARPWLRWMQTNETRPWTEHIARNRGAEVARGEYLFLIDIDYVIPKNTLIQARDFVGDRMDIERRFGVLDEAGEIRTDAETLRAYGLKERWVRKGGTPGHRSQFVMRADLFWGLGGYREELDDGTNHPKGGGAGQAFWNRWRVARNRGRVKLAEDTALVYMFPVGKFATSEDPLGLFHGLERCAT